MRDEREKKRKRERTNEHDSRWFEILSSKKNERSISIYE